MQKLKGGLSTGATVGLVAVVVFAMFGMFYLFSGGQFAVGPQAEPEAPETIPFECSSQTSPTVTVTTPDLYGGSALTSQNAYRKLPGGVWTDVAGAGTFALDPGVEVEFVYGIDTDDDSAEPFGSYIASWTVPCSETPEFSAGEWSCDSAGTCGVVDDALATDLDIIATDPEDGNTISASDPIDLDVNEVKTISAIWSGAAEEDFGNRFCEDVGDSNGATMSNVLVIRYNTTQYDDWYPTDLAGNKYDPAPVNINRILSASTGYTDAPFLVPVLRSNADWAFKLVVDTDDTAANQPTGGEGGVYNISNVTLYLYDVNYYFDNDVTPPEVKCGIFDEDAGEVGADAADSLVMYITRD